MKLVAGHSPTSLFAPRRIVIRTGFVARCVALALLIAPSLAAAQTAQAQKPFEPTIGQAGKDVVWVPTPPELVEKMLDMAKVTPSDLVMDLGSGDGRNIVAAAKRGARAIGVEFNPDMVALSRRLRPGSGRRRQGDLRRRRHVHRRHLEGDRHGAVPAAGQSRQAEGQVPRVAARQPDRAEHVRDPRMGA